MPKYRQEKVETAVARRLGHDSNVAPLPWAWIAASCKSPVQCAGFAAWWSWRCMDSVFALSAPCAMCGAECAPSAEHLSHDCAGTKKLVEDMGLSGGVRCLFSIPKAPDSFSIQLDVAKRILEVCTEAAHTARN